MNNWKQARDLYMKDHLSKPLADHQIRMNALKAIEKIFKENFPEPLNDENVFSNISRNYLMKLYECLKANRISASEKSVFNGLYKFAK